MILVNTDYISGKELEMLGLVKGSTIQSKHIGKAISQSFKTLVGGELKSYNEMMNEARALATKRMVAEAEELGADAVVNIRYASCVELQINKMIRGEFVEKENNFSTMCNNVSVNRLCVCF